jgi:FOG: TPR repeat, SEL1 subfamily
MTIPKLNFFETMIMAKNGNADAQFILGLMYNEGKGVPQDYTKAVQWFQPQPIRGSRKRNTTSA